MDVGKQTMSELPRLEMPVFNPVEDRHDRRRRDGDVGSRSDLDVHRLSVLFDRYSHNVARTVAQP